MDTHHTKSAIEEWKAHWPIAIASCLGISFAAVPLQSVGVFTEPLQQQFGWSNTLISLGASVFSLTVIPFAPFAGAIQDWLGTRLVAIVGVVLCIVAISALSLTSGSHVQWVGQWVFLAFAELPLKATVWVAAVSAVFVLGRGMALAICLSGSALAQTFVPLVSYALIAHFGWRPAYLLLGCGWGGPVLILVLLLLHDSGRGQRKANTLEPVDRSTLPGLSIAEAVRCAALYRVSLALMIITATSLAVITHNIPILHELGLSRGHAAALAASAGIAGIVGKVVTGWLYDRAARNGSGTSWINAQAYAGALIGFLIFMTAPQPGLLLLAMVLFGYGGGSSLQAAMYLVAQFSGQRNFGKIFGVKTSILAIGMGSGPLLGGLIRDLSGSYHPLFLVGAIGNFIAVALVVRLGPFPDWAARAKVSAGAGQALPPRPDRNCRRGIECLVERTCTWDCLGGGGAPDDERVPIHLTLAYRRCGAEDRIRPPPASIWSCRSRSAQRLVTKLRRLSDPVPQNAQGPL